MSQRDWDWTHKTEIVRTVPVPPARWQRTTVDYPQVEDSNEAAADIVQFCFCLFGQQAGWVEINVNSTLKVDRIPRGGPDGKTIKGRSPLPRRLFWHWYSPETALELAKNILHQSRIYGDVYISRCLYSDAAKNDNKRSADYVLPSRICIIDDPKIWIQPYAYASLETSPNNYQCLFKITDITCAAENEYIAKILGDMGDKSGSDLTQIIRVPNTLNTKQGRDFKVTWSGATHKMHTLERISEIALYHFNNVATYRRSSPVTAPDEPADQSTSTRASKPVAAQAYDRVATVAMQDVLRLFEAGTAEYQQHFDAAGIPHCVRQRPTKSLLLLYHEHPEQAPRAKNGDIDTSVRRFHEARDMKINGAPDHVIVAYVVFHSDPEGKKTQHWLLGDAARIIAKLDATIKSAEYEPDEWCGPDNDTPPDSMVPRITIPAVATSRVPVTTTQYLACLLPHLATGKVTLTQRSIAHQLRCSQDTVARRERELTQAGAIQRTISPCRQFSTVSVDPQGWQIISELLPHATICYQQQEMDLSVDQKYAGTSRMCIRGRFVPLQSEKCKKVADAITQGEYNCVADPSPAIELPPAAGERESAGVAARPACVRQIFRRAALLLRACLPGGEREAQGGRPKRWERSAQGGCVWRERAVCAYGRSLGRQARPPPAYGLLPLLY